MMRKNEVILLNVNQLVAVSHGLSEWVIHSFSKEVSGCIYEWVIESLTLPIRLKPLCVAWRIISVLLWLALELLFHCKIENSILTIQCLKCTSLNIIFLFVELLKAYKSMSHLQLCGYLGKTLSSSYIILYANLVYICSSS